MGRRTPSDPRALYDPSKQIRNAATYYDPNQIKLKLSFAEAYKGTLHLYAVDWDSTARREIITVNGQSAAARRIQQGSLGLVPDRSRQRAERATIIVDRTAGANAVLSGIFLGEGGAPPSPAVSISPKGSWVGSYGSAGYDLGGWDEQSDVADLPNVSLSLAQGSRYVWAASTSETRALQSPDGLTREAATYYDPNEIRLQLSFSEAYTGTLHLYAVDWDSSERRELITVDGQTAVLGEFHERRLGGLPDLGGGR